MKKKQFSEGCDTVSEFFGFTIHNTEDEFPETLNVILENETEPSYRYVWKAYHDRWDLQEYHGQDCWVTIGKIDGIETEDPACFVELMDYVLEEKEIYYANVIINAIRKENQNAQ